MSIATPVKGSTIGGIDISFALIGLPFALLFCHCGQDLQYLATSIKIPGQ